MKYVHKTTKTIKIFNLDFKNISYWISILMF